MNNVEIKSEEGKTKVKIDGKEIGFVKRLNFEHKVDNVQTVTIEFYTNNVDVSIDKAKVVKSKVS